MLASDQIWSVGLGECQGLILLALKPPEAHKTFQVLLGGFLNNEELLGPGFHPGSFVHG